MAKISIQGKKFATVKEKLEFIQKNCNETEIFEDLSILFKMRGYNDVKITHGTNEFGKDLVFNNYDNDFEEVRWHAVIVKNKPARQNDFLPGNEIYNQIELAFKNPYKDLKGEERNINKLFIVINGNITPNAIEVLKQHLAIEKLNNLVIWDYQKLTEQIEKYSKELFLNQSHPTHDLYVRNQIKKLSDISKTNSAFALKFDDIEEIFVNVETTYSRELRRVNRYVTYDEDVKGKIDESDIEGSSEVLSSNKNFIIHGIPTSGKTIFLKRIGIKALRETSATNAVFYFDLQNHNAQELQIPKLIEAQYKELTLGEEFDESKYDKVILLFDSIDFIKDIRVRKSVLAEIESFSSQEAKNKYQIIVATRYIDWIQAENILKDFKESELLPFSFGQAMTLVKKVIPNNTSKAQSFIKALRDSMLNTSIQRTPLSLTLLAILYRDDKIDLKELPANIFALYDLFTSVYLDKWDSAKGITQLYKYEQTKNVLAFIALHIHSHGQNQISEEDLKHFLIDLRGKYNYEELDDIDSFIGYLKSRNGVFYYDKVNASFAFFNHYFQEYFASLSIEDEEDETLLDNFFDSWWSNSLVFYCGKNPKSFRLHNSIVQKIIPINIFQKYTYLINHSRCLQASHAISIADRQKVVNKLIKEVDEFYKLIYTQATTNAASPLSKLPFVSILNYCRSVFEEIFGSKHISTKETLKSFEEALLNQDAQISMMTRYNLAYFLSYESKDAFPFEVLSDYVTNGDLEYAVWNRIIFVDVNVLKLKKKISDDKFKRIRRKMNKKKHVIQHLLQSNLIELTKLEAKS